MSRLAAVVAVLSLLSGCWLQVGFGPEHRRFNPDETGLTIDNVASLAPAWSVEVPDAVAEPIVSGNRVYVSRSRNFPNASAAVRALDANSGATVWDTPVAEIGARVNMNVRPVAVAGGDLWVSYSGSTFLSPPACPGSYARLGTDGTIISNETTGPARYWSSAVEAAGVVVRTTAECPTGPLQLVVQDPKTAALLWSYQFVTGPNFGPAIPTLADGRIFVPLGSTLYAFNVGGCGSGTCPPLWSVDVGPSLEARTTVGGTDGEIFVVTFTGTTAELIALSAGTGAELWRAPLNTNDARLALANGVVYVSGGTTGTAPNSLQAFAAGGCGAATCSPLWSASAGAALTTAPVVAGGVVYVGFDGAVRAYDAAGCGAPTCSEVVSVPVTGYVSSLSVAQGKLFAASTGRVTALAAT